MPAPAIYDLPQLYDIVMPPGPCEAFYRSAAARAAGPVLELACGTGRLTVPLAQGGFEIVGVDASAAMLAVARRKAALAGARRAGFVQADMRSLALGRRFALVIISCNTLGHLTTAADLSACLEGVARHLAPGGVLAFDVVNPRVDLLARPEAEVRPVAIPAGAPVAIDEHACYDPVRQVRTAWWHVRRGDAPAQALAALALRQFFPQELPVLLSAHGFHLVERHGDFDGGPFGADSLNQVCLAVRA